MKMKRKNPSPARSSAQGASRGAADSPPKQSNLNKCREVEKLVARWKFLRADEIYQSTIANTVEESNARMLMHVPELDQIEEQLAKIVPNNFNETHELLQFAIGIAKEYILNDTSVDSLMLGILSNVDEALDIMRDEEELRIYKATLPEAGA